MQLGVRTYVSFYYLYIISVVNRGYHGTHVFACFVLHWCLGGGMLRVTPLRSLEHRPSGWWWFVMCLLVCIVISFWAEYTNSPCCTQHHRLCCLRLKGMTDRSWHEGGRTIPIYGGLRLILVLFWQ